MTLRNKLDGALNAATIVIAAVLLIIAISGAHRKLIASAASGLTRGTEMVIPGVDWTRHGRSLVLALQPACNPTEASLPFYKDLLASINGHDLHPILLTPHPVSVGRQLAKDYQLEISDVRTESFEDVHVPGSPTLLLVDHDGRLLKAWIGQLSVSREEDVFRTLGIARRAAFVRHPSEPHRSQLVHPVAAGVVLDTRSRDEASRSPISGAVNIPLEELEVRLIHEVPKDEVVSVVCDYCVECGGNGQRSLASRCDLAQRLIAGLGFDKAKYLGRVEFEKSLVVAGEAK